MPIGCCISASKFSSALPLELLDRLSLQQKLNDIGRMEGATAKAQSRRDAIACAARSPNAWGRRSCSRPWSAPASWRSGLPAVTARLRCLCNTLPTGAILAVLILVFGPLSGAHFNPAVSLAFALRGELPWPIAALYIGRKCSARLSASGRRI